jgi:putative ABC transport system ATP-binding protein
MKRSTMALIARALRVAPALGEGLAWTLTLAMIGQAVTILTPIVLQSVIDDEILAPEGPSLSGVLLKTGVALVALVVGVFVARAAVLRLVATSSNGLSDLRVMTFRHLLHRSVLHVESSRRGVMVARVTSDIGTIQEFMEWGGIGLVISVSQVALAVGAMAFYEWRLAVVSVIGILVYLVVMRLSQRLLRRRYDLVRAEVGRSLGVLSESISAIPVVRAYGIEDLTREKVDEALERRFVAEFRAGRFGATLFSSAEIFAGVMTAAMVVGGILIGSDGGMTAGRLVALLFLSNLLVEPLQIVVQTLDQAQSAAAGLRRILTVLDSDVEISEPEDPRPLRPGGLSARFKDVSFAYGEGEPVLEEVTVDIPVGSRIAVVGETGSGKTTFAKLLVRLLDPASGEIYVGGERLDRIRLEELRSRVAFVPQEGFLFDDNLAENIRYGRPEASDAEIWTAFHELELGQWVEGLPDGLQTQVGEGGSNLSTGERQLVALVRAWIGSPDLLVLDEATSAVDPALDVSLRHAMAHLIEGRTSVTIAHRLSTAESADRVLVFNDGRLVESGTHVSLLDARGVYAALYADWATGTKSV